MLDPSTFRNLDGLYSNKNNQSGDNLFRNMPPMRSTKKMNNNLNTNNNKFDDTIIGMPIRPLNNKSSFEENNNQSKHSSNHLDFNLFDVGTNLQVGSYNMDGISSGTSTGASYGQQMYSEISNFGSPLLTPLKQSPEYFMTLMMNCLSFDLITVLDSITKSKFYCISSMPIMASLNFMYSLYASNEQITNLKLLTKFFQNKQPQYVNNSLVRLSSDIKNLSDVSSLTIALVNDPGYQSQASELNKYNLGTCLSYYINPQNSKMLLHKINKLMHVKTNKQMNTLIDINSDAFGMSLLTGNTVFLYNFTVLSPQIKTPFLKQDTRKGFFYEDDGSNKKLVNYMKQNNTTANYYQDANVTLLEFECTNGQGFGILMSKNKSYKYQNLEDYINNLKLTSFDYIIIPKIKYQTKLKLNETLKKMGLQGLFSRTKENKFGISTLETYVTILLEDTKSYSLEDTQVNRNLSSSPLIDDKKIKFKANKPFVFYIRTINNNCINLAGRFC